MLLSLLRGVTAGYAIGRELGDRRDEGNDLGNLGSAYQDLGEVEKAIGYYEQALAIGRELGDRQGESEDLGFQENFRKMLR